MTQPRPKLILNKPLSEDILFKIKLKRSPEEIEKIKITNRKLKNLRIKEALDWLCKQYPNCFNRLNPKPLKLKIEQDIFKMLGLTVMAIDQQIPILSIYSKKLLYNAVGYYTRNIRYHRSILHYSYRIDLQGQEIINYPVTEQQRDYALKIISLIEAKNRKIKPAFHSKP